MRGLLSRVGADWRATSDHPLSRAGTSDGEGIISTDYASDTPEHAASVQHLGLESKGEVLPPPVLGDIADRANVA